MRILSCASSCLTLRLNSDNGRASHDESALFGEYRKIRLINRIKLCKTQLAGKSLTKVLSLVTPSAIFMGIHFLQILLLEQNIHKLPKVLTFRSAEPGNGILQSIPLLHFSFFHTINNLSIYLGCF